MPTVSDVLDWRMGDGAPGIATSGRALPDERPRSGDPVIIRSGAGAGRADTGSLDTGTRYRGDLEGPRGWYPSVAKRAVDLVGASLLLLVLSPLLLGIWCALRLTLGRNVVLRQERIGRSGEVYPCLKFRTMAHCRRSRSHGYMGPNRRQTHKSDADPRHTRLGRFLRRHSLDEILQLVNVMRGQMSLVGPRPELASVATESFTRHKRHTVRPGLTGPYQVSEHRTSGRLVEGLSFDEDYVASVSFMTDIRLLVATISPVARGFGS